MPYAALTVSIPVNESQRQKLLGSMSQILAEETHKPVQYVMAAVQQADMAHGRDTAPSAFADIRSIGALNKSTNAAISRRFCDMLDTELGIAPSRIYLNFSDIAAVNWGNDGGVFGA
jgi:phenylpyruvate tautomerase